MPLHFPKQIVLFQGGSANSSTYTSTDHLVADYAQISVSHQTVVAVASRLTLQGSNDDGLQSAIVLRSTLSDIGAPGIYAVTPGMRWIRALRSALDSTGTVILQLRT